MNQKITIETVVKAPMSKVWKYWNDPEHIIKWAFASSDWEAPSAENDLRIGGRFKTVMRAKDLSSSFDFLGEYTDLRENSLIQYRIDDGRKVRVEFKETHSGIRITETFDPENENSREVQQAGWQAILENFKDYTENN